MSIGGLPPIPLFTHPSVVFIDAADKPFVAQNHFVESTKQNAEVRILRIGANFKKWFLAEGNGPGKIEGPISRTALCYSKLQNPSSDDQIIENFGGEAKIRTTLRAGFSLLKLQRDGGRGDLDIGGAGNNLYIADKTNITRCVVFEWNPPGWVIGAITPQTDPYKNRIIPWGIGRRIFYPCPAEIPVLRCHLFGC